jgi:putative ABC transport system substrate-binding protein
MEMKKSIILILIVLFTLGFAACSNTSAVKEDVTIGIVQFGDHPSLDNCREGFLEGLEEAGYVEGENLTVKYQSAQFDAGTASLIAESFVTDNVDMICAIATPAAQAAYNAASDTDIPVIFTAVTDPNAAMLTEGNITGTSDKLPVEAQLQLIRALMPNAAKIGILYTTSEVNSQSTIEEYKAMAPTYGFEIVDVGISTSADIPLAADNLVNKVDCITNLTDNTVVGSLTVVLDKANTAGIPVFGSEIEQVKLGCVAAEGIEYLELGKQTGQIAASVLNGEKTADEIEYQIIDNSSLYVNTQAMKKFNFTLTDDFRERATEVTAE